MWEFQCGTWGAQCEHLEISSLPRCVGKTDVSNWSPLFGEPAPARRRASHAYNRTNRYNRFGMSVAGHFANYIYKTRYREESLDKLSPIRRAQVSGYELHPAKTSCI